MIYITGDVHGKIDRFSLSNFPQQKEMSRDDYLIVCGDFGFVWSGSELEKAGLDMLENLPFTLLFITGNHENYDLLESYPVSEWHGGRVQYLRPHVIHLMRGQVFAIEGKTFFTMGGAECHDVWNGIQDPADPNFQANCLRLQMMDEFYRVKGESWWPQELPTEAEYEEGWRNLQKHGMCVDCVISHCAPQSIQKELFGRQYPENSLTDYLQQVSKKMKFGAWYFGHYHTNIKTSKYELIYKEFRKL